MAFRTDVSEKIGLYHNITRIEELVKVFSIQFDRCQPFINFDGAFGLATKDVSVFIDITGFNVAIGDDFYMADSVTKLNQLISEHKLNNNEVESC